MYVCDVHNYMCVCMILCVFVYIICVCRRACVWGLCVCVDLCDIALHCSIHTVYVVPPIVWHCISKYVTQLMINFDGE